MELLLVDRVAACWLYLHLLETGHAQKGPWHTGKGTPYEKFLDRAHKQYLAAIKALATVRKLAVPVLQVNIGDKQINVAGPARDGPDDATEREPDCSGPGQAVGRPATDLARSHA